MNRAEAHFAELKKDPEFMHWYSQLINCSTCENPEFQSKMIQASKGYICGKCVAKAMSGQRYKRKDVPTKE